ncbi:flavodoxin domain-containing protein [Erythrobacter sp. GH1-10]|uniref:flavodoxin domain-containing protein n=1 Tax=Erythrobacter sp. GH1-10 TaxID=3349334 RepID=UPI003877C19C
MNGAIFYLTRYGSTAEYAGWIAEDSGLPAFDLDESPPPLSGYDFIVLVTPIYYYKPLILPWLAVHLAEMRDKPVVFVTVSGAPAGEKLDGWLRKYLPPEFHARMHHVALRGRQDPRDLGWFPRLMLQIAAFFNPDKQAAKEEAEGFDFVDRTSIAPALALIEDLKLRKAA